MYENEIGQPAFSPSSSMPGAVPQQDYASDIGSFGFISDVPEVSGTEYKTGFKDIGQDFLAPVKDPSLFLDNARSVMAKGLSGINSAAGDYLRRESPVYETTPEMLKLADERDVVASDFSAYADLLKENVDKKYVPKTKLGTIAKGVSGSTPSMMLGVLASFVGGPAVGYAIGSAAGAGQAFSTKYEERTEMGDDPDYKMNSSMLHGVSEGLSEAIGLPAYTKLFKVAKAGAAITPAIAREAFMEGAEEVVAGIPQGLEDAFRGKGKTPSGLQGMKDYVASGQMLQQAVDDFVGGVMMGAATGAALKPVQMSYKPAALRQANTLSEAIRVAKANGDVAVDVEGSPVPIAQLEERLVDLKESFDIKDSDILPGEVSAQEEQARLLNSAIDSIKNLTAKPVTQEQNSTNVEQKQNIEGQDSSLQEASAEGIIDSDVEGTGSTAVPGSEQSDGTGQIDNIENFNIKLDEAEKDHDTWLLDNASKVTKDIPVSVTLGSKATTIPASTALKTVDTQIDKLDKLKRCLNGESI